MSEARQILLDKVKRQKLINFLVDDFKKMFPDHGHWEIRQLELRLHNFDVSDLKLLASQCEGFSDDLP